MTARRRDVLRGAAALVVAGGLRLRRADAAPPARMRARRLAWAGVQLEAGNVSLWLDPLVSRDVWGPALADALVPMTASASASRYVLVTHRHPDHFDAAAVRAALGETGFLVCSTEVAPLAAGRGFKVRLAPLYEPVLLDEFTATAVPAVDGYGDPQVSWVVSGGGRRIIHCGDTLWHGSWWHIGRQYGPFDAAFLPINGARFRWRKPYSEVPAVMTAEQAVAAAVVLGARLLVPIHYGIVGAEKDGYIETPDPEAALIAAARRRAMPVEIVRPGEWLTWRPRR